MLDVKITITDDGKLQIGDLAPLTPREAVTLAFEMVTRVEHHVVLPEMVQVEDPDYDDGRRDLRCPHCDMLAKFDTEDAVVELDWDTGENGAYFGFHGFGAGTGPATDPIVHVSQGDTAPETIAFACAACGELVALPGEVEVTWS